MFYIVGNKDCKPVRCGEIIKHTILTTWWKFYRMHIPFVYSFFFFLPLICFMFVSYVGIPIMFWVRLEFLVLAMLVLYINIQSLIYWSTIFFRKAYTIHNIIHILSVTTHNLYLITFPCLIWYQSSSPIERRKKPIKAILQSPANTLTFRRDHFFYVRRVS